VAIDYSLLMVSRWREERSHGHSGEEAVQRAIETAGRAVVFSGITVAIGLLSLIALPVPFLRSMGYGGVLIPLVSTLVAITLLPVVLAKLGPRLDWPHRRTDDKASRAWTRWAQAVARRRWVAAAGGMAVVLALAFAATDLQMGSDHADTMAKSGDAKLGLLALEKAGIGAGALLPHEVLVAGPTSPERVAGELRKVAGIHGAVAPDSSAWRRGGTALVEAVPVPDGGSDAGSATLQRVRQAAHSIGPDVRVGGQPAENADFIDAVDGSFPLIIALIAITTFVLLARASDPSSTQRRRLREALDRPDEEHQPRRVRRADAQDAGDRDRGRRPAAAPRARVDCRRHRLLSARASDGWQGGEALA
jgi:RND superfamily putative drug exporter